LSKSEVESREAKIKRESVGGKALDVSVEEFQRGLEIELEYSSTFSDAKVTNNLQFLLAKLCWLTWRKPWIPILILKSLSWRGICS